MPTENKESNAENQTPNVSSKRLRVLISAYACEPGKGSEAGVGWNMALQMAKLHDVTVLTRANNEPVITPELPEKDAPKFIYYDLPKWAMWWKRGARGAQLYYYLWQVFSGRMLKKKYAGSFDVGHHVTFVRYWMPTCFPIIGIPYVIGPVGGGEFAPVEFENRFPLKPLIYEKVRRLIRAFVPLDPFVRKSIKRAACVLSTTKESAAKIQKLGARWVEIYPESGVSQDEFDQLSVVEDTISSDPFVFVSSGRLLALKAFEMGLRAYAEADVENSEYWIVGNGPERRRLEAVVSELNLQEKVKFFGMVPRSEALEVMGRANVLVHPSLHDSGGWVCPEAMAMGKAVICLNLGGPGAQVNEKTGIRVDPGEYKKTVEKMANAMREMASSSKMLEQMGIAGRREVAEKYIWENKCGYYSSIYRQILEQAETGDADA
jgi:glycosyltransferase involved in cell wall biosynthesis